MTGAGATSADSLLTTEEYGNQAKGDSSSRTDVPKQQEFLLSFLLLVLTHSMPCHKEPLFNFIEVFVVVEGLAYISLCKVHGEDQK